MTILHVTYNYTAELCFFFIVGLCKKSLLLASVVLICISSHSYCEASDPHLLVYVSLGKVFLNTHAFVYMHFSVDCDLFSDTAKMQ